MSSTSDAAALAVAAEQLEHVEASFYHVSDNRHSSRPQSCGHLFVEGMQALFEGQFVSKSCSPAEVLGLGSVCAHSVTQRRLSLNC